MKDRIFQVMKMENMTQQDFAAALDVSPSSLSSIFNGRTNPTSNHVQAIHRRFPNISVNWLMFGEGDMYVHPITDSAPSPTGESSSSLSDGTPTSVNVSVDTMASHQDSSTASLGSSSEMTARSRIANVDEALLTDGLPIVREVVKYIDKPVRKVTEIRIFFNDGTYETFQAGK